MEHVEWIPHPLDDFLIWFLGLGLLGVGINRTWVWFVKPAAQGLVKFWKGITHLVQVLDILHEIAQQFQPDGGSSLIDRVESIQEMDAQLQLGIDNLTQQFEHHILFFGEYVTPLLQSLDPTIPQHPELTDSEIDELGGAPV